MDLRERYSIVATGFCSQHILYALGHSGAELTVGQNGRRQNRIGRRQTGGDDQSSGDIYLEHQGSEEGADEPAKGHDDCWDCVSLIVPLSDCTSGERSGAPTEICVCVKEDVAKLMMERSAQGL